MAVPTLLRRRRQSLASSWVSPFQTQEVAGPDSRLEQAAARHWQITRGQASYQIIMRRHIKGRTMSVIDCEYLPEPGQVQLPPGLALLIIKKAAALAEAFESKALEQMTMDASRAPRDGMEPHRII